MRTGSPPALLARLVRLKAFVAQDPDVETAIADVQAQVNVWLENAGERRLVDTEWSIDGETVTAGIWYFD